MADKFYKPLALDLVEQNARAAKDFLRQSLKIETWAAEGRAVGRTGRLDKKISASRAIGPSVTRMICLPSASESEWLMKSAKVGAPVLLASSRRA